jgi:hypothetical protein
MAYGKCSTLPILMRGRQATTRRKDKTEATDMEGLLGQDEAFIRTRVKAALQEVLEAEMGGGGWRRLPVSTISI